MHTSAWHVETAADLAASQQSSRILCPLALLRLCVVRRRAAGFYVQVGGYAVALTFHGFHRQPQPLALLRSARIGGHALLIIVGRLLVLVAGNDLFGNSASCERKYESKHSYDAHAILPPQPSSF